MDFWQIFWLAWIGVFFVGEGVALYRGKGTLSEQLWRWFKIRRYGEAPQPGDTAGWARALHFVPLAVLLWIAVHISTGGWI